MYDNDITKRYYLEKFGNGEWVKLVMLGNQIDILTARNVDSKASRKSWDCHKFVKAANVSNQVAWFVETMTTELL